MDVKMCRITALALVVIVVCSAFFVESGNGAVNRPIIRIRSDGTVDPASSPIQRNANTYVFTGDAQAEVVVEKSNIVIDGTGHTLTGPYNGSQTLWIIGEGPNQTPTNDTELWSIGIDTAASIITGLTIKNLNIKNFSIGMYLWTADNTVTGNAITDSIVGILLSGNGNIITGNYIANNKNGVYFGSNQPGNVPSNVVISENCFVDNIRQLSGCVCVDYNTTEAKHTWDNGEKGNYWSDYNGADGNGDGIGDTPYVIDVLNADRYPLMQSPANPPTTTSNWPVEIIVAVAALSIITVAAAIIFTKKRKKTGNQDIM